MNTVECELTQILIAEQRDAQMIVLREKDGERAMPIEIGIVEAMAINRHVQQIETIRPMTHDLLLSVIENMGGTLKRIVVNDLVTLKSGQGTFYGLLVVEREGSEIEVDCRPSDAIALAVRVGCPVFVAEHVLAAIAGPS